MIQLFLSGFDDYPNFFQHPLKMRLTPGRRKKAKEHDDRIPHKWGRKFMVIQWVMYILGEVYKLLLAMVRKKAGQRR